MLAELSGVIERLTAPDDILQAAGERMGPYLQLADCKPPRLQPTGPAQPPHADRCHRVLIADDNADAADTLALLLGLEGHTTAIARDGMEAARRIRALPGGPAMRLVALTGWGQFAHPWRRRFRPQEVGRGRLLPGGSTEALRSCRHPSTPSVIPMTCAWCRWKGGRALT